MSYSNSKGLPYTASNAQPELRTHELGADLRGVPNFVHVGENPHALEGYLRLYVRDWITAEPGDSTH